MFDELKEIRYFKEITDFKSLIVKNFKGIKRLKGLQFRKKCSRLQPKQASTMNLFYEYT